MELGARNSAADQRMGKAKGQMVGYCWRHMLQNALQQTLATNSWPAMPYKCANNPTDLEAGPEIWWGWGLGRRVLIIQKLNRGSLENIIFRAFLKNKNKC